MSKIIKQFLFSFGVIFSLIGSVSAYTLEEKDITLITSGENTDATFSKYYETHIAADNATKDFIEYVINKKGVVVYTEVKEILNETTKEIFAGKIETSDLLQIESEIAKIQAEYDKKSTENKSYEIVLGDMEKNTVVEESEKHESGILGEFDTKEEAEKAKEEALKNNSENFTLICTISKSQHLVSTDRQIINEKFSTKEEAEAYVESLKNKGYAVAGIKIVPKTTTIVQKEEKTSVSMDELKEYVANLEKEGYIIKAKYSQVGTTIIDTQITNINKDFASLEEANAYKNKLEQDYDEVNVSITDTSYTNNVSGSVNQTFNTKEEAEEYLNNLKEEYTVTNASITENKKEISRTEEETIKNIFDTKEDAEAYKKVLEQKGYTILNSKINENVVEGTGAVLTVNKTDRNSPFILAEPNNYIMIKQGSGSVAVWTKEALSDAEKEIFKESYFIANDVDGSTTSVSRFEFINGFGSFDLSYIGSNWGVYTFADNNGVTLTFNESKVSHINYGTYDSSNINYELEATLTKITYEKSYTVTANTSKEEFIARYNVKGSVLKNALAPLYKVSIEKIKEIVEYEVNGEITKDIYKDVYTLNYESTEKIINTKVKYTQNYSVKETNIDKKYLASGLGYLYIMGYVGGSDYEPSNTMVPKTGINGNNYGGLIVLIITMLGLLNITYYSKNNK